MYNNVQSRIEFYYFSVPTSGGTGNTMIDIMNSVGCDTTFSEWVSFCQIGRSSSYYTLVHVYVEMNKELREPYTININDTIFKFQRKTPRLSLMM